jgi:hypothetical protein
MAVPSLLTTAAITVLGGPQAQGHHDWCSVRQNTGSTEVHAALRHI